MNTKRQSRQLQLFPGEQVPWETLTEESQQSVAELLSLLIEQLVKRRQQATATDQEKDHHV